MTMHWEKRCVETVQHIEIHGYILTATVNVSSTNDEYEYGDTDDKEEYARNFRSCVWECVTLRVVATWKGLEGIDMLGGVVLTPSYVVDSALEENGMIANALTELKRAIEGVQLFNATIGGVK